MKCRRKGDEKMERHYYTYLIKEEFANHYFGRESVMFELFQDYHWTSLTKQSSMK